MNYSRCSNCAQKPKLRQTGKSPDNTQWYCPICKIEYYDDNGKITADKPAKWPSNKKDIKNYELKKGYWREV